MNVLVNYLVGRINFAGSWIYEFYRTLFSAEFLAERSASIVRNRFFSKFLCIQKIIYAGN